MPNRTILIIKIISKRVVVEAVQRGWPGEVGVDGSCYQHNAWIKGKIIVTIKP